VLPDNISLLFLPPYAPELNPKENLWDEIRDKIFKNYALKSIEPCALNSRRQSSSRDAASNRFSTRCVEPCSARRRRDGSSRQGYRWSINNVAWTKDVPPLVVAEGEKVELVITNQTMMSHPMHLHGHTFQVVVINSNRFAGPCATQCWCRRQPRRLASPCATT
jgi:multicopper oxidase/DDE superfamily endonuclease